MTDQLPPSKFGKGYTYGGPDQSAPSQHIAPPSAYPGSQSSPAAFGGGGYQVPPPVHNPYAPPSAPDPYGVTNSHIHGKSYACSGWLYQRRDCIPAKRSNRHFTRYRNAIVHRLCGLAGLNRLYQS